LRRTRFTNGPPEEDWNRHIFRTHETYPITHTSISRRHGFYVLCMIPSHHIEKRTILSLSQGGSVSISGSGNRIAVGGHYNDANGSNAGHVRVFDLSFDGDSNTWNQVDKDILGQSAGDKSGWRVALSNDAKFLAVGEVGRNFNSGGARVFEMKCQSEE